MLDKKSGVWLSHSTPKFPTYRSKDFWPDSGTANAQTFMCVTYSYNHFKEIGKLMPVIFLPCYESYLHCNLQLKLQFQFSGLQLKYIHAYSYDFDIPTTFRKELQCVAQRSCLPKKEPWFRVTMLTSMKGHNFSSFVKYNRFRDGECLKSINQSIKFHFRLMIT